MYWKSKLCCAPVALIAVLAAGCASGGSAATSGMAPAPEPAQAAAPTNEAGRSIFMVKGNCYACHGATGKGTMVGPDLTDDQWLIADGTLASIIRVVTEGVPRPTTSEQPMPARGGGVLSDAEIRSVAEYVVSLRGST